jgi:hypothetical protein
VYGGLEVLLHVFLTSAFDRNQWPMSFPSLVTAGGKKSYATTKLNRMPEEPQSQFRHFKEEKNLVPAGN